MKNEFDLQRLHIAAFTQSGGSFSGSEPLSRFGRLLEESQGLGDAETVHFSLQGSVKSDPAGLDEPWIHLSASTKLLQVCQRCLGKVAVAVDFERDFRFVASEALAEVEDEESEEDVLVISKAFNLLDLIEDELLMAMPPVPKHEVCPTPVKLEVKDEGFVSEPSNKPNPFAALHVLKKKDEGSV